MLIYLLCIYLKAFAIDHHCVFWFRYKAVKWLIFKGPCVTGFFANQ